MMMSHANRSSKEDIKCSLQTDGLSNANRNNYKSAKCSYPKLTRFKLIVMVILLVILAAFTTYEITLIFQPSPRIETGIQSFIIADSLNTSERYTDKIRYKHTKRRLPQCIIIGIRKCGTRALLTYLNLHPHIRTASEEIHFFNEEENYNRGLEWYRKRMPYTFPEEMTIEKTPAYFSTRIVPDRVYFMNSSIKLLLVVREPLERTISDYLQISIKKQSKNLPVDSFEKMVMTVNGKINVKYPPLVRSVYHMYMENWLQRFNIEQFHIVDGDNLLKDPYSEIQSIETFLGLDHRIKKENFYFNESRGFYCIRNETREKCLSPSKGREHPAIDPIIKQRLKDFLRPYNEKFFELAKRRFDWG